MNSNGCSTRAHKSAHAFDSFSKRCDVSQNYPAWWQNAAGQKSAHLHTSVVITLIQMIAKLKFDFIQIYSNYIILLDAWRLDASQLNLRLIRNWHRQLQSSVCWSNAIAKSMLWIINNSIVAYSCVWCGCQFSLITIQLNYFDGFRPKSFQKISHFSYCTHAPTLSVIFLRRFK